MFRRVLLLVSASEFPPTVLNTMIRNKRKRDKAAAKIGKRGNEEMMGELESGDGDE